MKFSILFLTIVAISISGYSQSLASTSKEKPSLDLDVFSHWTSLYNAGISNDGSYAYYTTRQNLYDRNEELTVQSLKSDWKVTVPNIIGRTIIFSSDSKYLYCLNWGDSL